MALPAFDAERHAIGLGTAGSERGFTIAGAYRKTFKRDQAGDQNGVHYGSDSYFNSPGVSSWTMDDFTGGQFQYVWGHDNKMFNRCHNMIPMDFDRSLRTVPPMRMSAATGVGGGIYSGSPLAFYNSQGWACAFYQDRIYRHVMTPGGSAVETFLPTFSGAQYSHAVYDPRSGYVLSSFINGLGPGIGVHNALTGAHIVGYSVQPGALVPYGAITGMNCNGDKLVLAAGNVLFTVTMQDDSYNFISGDYTKIGRLPGTWLDSAWSGGMLYILLGGSDKKVQLVAFDGVQVMPVCEFPYNFHGYCVEAYGGRIYVGGAGLDYNGAVSYGELYEVTGSSLRLLKSFAPEKKSGRYQYNDAIYSMVVHEGLLHFGRTGQGLICYDVTTDSFFGGPMLDAGRTNAGRMILSLISGRGRIWAYVNHPSAPGDNAIWNTIIAGDSAPLAANPGIFVSSDFGPELDRIKAWDRVRVLTRGDSQDPIVYTSIDGGANWTLATQTTEDTCGQAGVLRTYTVNSVDSHAISVLIYLYRNTSPTVSFAELAGFSASFKLIDSDDVNADGTEKLAWSFAIAGVEDIEMQDGTVETHRLEEIRDQLWSWAQNKTQLSFKDADGTTHTVKIDSISESQPAVLPPVDYDDPTSAATQEGREAFYSVVLTEV